MILQCDAKQVLTTNAMGMLLATFDDGMTELILICKMIIFVHTINIIIKDALE